MHIRILWIKLHCYFNIFQIHLNHHRIHVVRLRVVRMLYAKRETELVPVLVCRNISEIPTLVVVLNVFRTQTVTVTKPVQTIDVKIHALALVESMQNVEQ